MATNITERFNEMTALAALTAATGALADLVKEQSGKRYARSATTRRERWLQIASLAEQQAQRTASCDVKRAVKRKAACPAPPATPPSHPPVTDLADAVAMGQ